MELSLVWDIETGPLPDDLLRDIFAEVPLPAPPGRFVEADVKLGQMKDKAKIEAKIDAAKVKHKKAVDDYDKTCRELQSRKFAEFKDKAALSAGTGQVVACGMLRYADPTLWIAGQQANFSEAELITQFWGYLSGYYNNKFQCIGHNIYGFDLPFLIQRSWILGVQIPDSLRDPRGHWHPNLRDTMTAWALGKYGSFVKLDALAAFFGIEGKSGEGKHFAGLWLTDRRAAMDYLTQDLKVTWNVAERMNLGKG